MTGLQSTVGNLSTYPKWPKILPTNVHFGSNQMSQIISFCDPIYNFSSKILACVPSKPPITFQVSIELSEYWKRNLWSVTFLWVTSPQWCKKCDSHFQFFSFDFFNFSNYLRGLVMKNDQQKVQALIIIIAWAWWNEPGFENYIIMY